MSQKPKKVAKGSAAEQSKVGVKASTNERRTKGKAGVKGGKPGTKGMKRLPDARSDPPPKKGIRGVPGSLNDSRRCKAKANSTGERCKRAAIKGGVVCMTHGGATKRVQKSAQERLLALLDPALATLHKILTDPNAEDAVKVRAALGALDRTGYGPNQTVTLQSSEWDEATDAMLNEMMSANNGQFPVNRDLGPVVRGGGRQPVNVQSDDDDFEWPEDGDVVEGELIEDDDGSTSEESFPARSSASRQDPEGAARQTIWGDDDAKRNIGASEFDPTRSGPYEPGALTKEERLARDLEGGKPPRNQKGQR